MSKYLFIGIIVILFSFNIVQLYGNHIKYRLPKDMVPNEQTARAIAYNVLLAGHDDDDKEKVLDSYNVTYLPQKKAWLVHKSIPEGYLGGGFEIVIRKNDGKIMEYHIL